MLTAVIVPHFRSDELRLTDIHHQTTAPVAARADARLDVGLRIMQRLLDLWLNPGRYDRAVALIRHRNFSRSGFTDRFLKTTYDHMPGVCLTMRNQEMILFALVSQTPRLRLLLVDDNADMLEAMQLLLQPVCDVVGLVSDARKALETVNRLRPDVVLLDISMPHISGLEVCRRIKAAIPEIRIVILTAFGDQATRDIAFNAGASGVEAKHSVNVILEALTTFARCGRWPGEDAY